MSILAVLCGHFISVPDIEQHGLMARIFLRLAWNGAYGVSIFFVISGFLITRMIDGPRGRLFEPDIPAFYIRRVSRIAPMLILVAAIGITVIRFGFPRAGGLEVTFRNPQASFDWVFWASVAFFFFNWVRIRNEPRSFGYGMNWDVLWSLAIEEQFYVGYPWLLRVLKTRRRLVLVLLSIVAMGPLYRWHAYRTNPQSFLLGFTHSLAAFDQLAIGVLAYLIHRNWERPSNTQAWRKVLAVLGLAIAAAVYLKTQAAVGRDRILGPSLLAMGVALLLVGGIDHPWSESPIWRPLRWIGEASYEAYLLHSFALYLLWPWLIQHHHLIQSLAVYLALVMGLSVSVHNWVEEPIKRWCTSVLTEMIRGRMRRRAS